MSSGDALTKICIFCIKENNDGFIRLPSTANLKLYAEFRWILVRIKILAEHIDKSGLEMEAQLFY